MVSRIPDDNIATISADPHWPCILQIPLELDESRDSSSVQAQNNCSVHRGLPGRNGPTGASADKTSESRICYIRLRLGSNFELNKTCLRFAPAYAVEHNGKAQYIAWF
jgi:hypothetical protein